MFEVSVIIPTHNPDARRLQRTLAGLRAQTLASKKWEAVLVDNASSKALKVAEFKDAMPENFRVVPESKIGLTWARRRGFEETESPFLVMADDDNVLAPDYLENVLFRFGQNPSLGAMGGRCIPEFESEPPAWMREFYDLLALRDFGNSAKFSGPLRDKNTGQFSYPLCAPVGAGMAVRREAIQTWLREAASTQFSDRRGNQLTSGGDNHLILSMMKAGWEVAYFPELQLLHLIPNNRTQTDYMARLNRGIQESWMRLLTLHGINPWTPIAKWSVPLRKIKSWFTFRAWASEANYIRWRGTCGHFSGRAIHNE